MRFKELGISQVFDLRSVCLPVSPWTLHQFNSNLVCRSDTEIAKYNTPGPEIDGVQISHVPVFKKEDYSPEMMAKCVRCTRVHPLRIGAETNPPSRRYQLYASGKIEVCTVQPNNADLLSNKHH